MRKLFSFGFLAVAVISLAAVAFADTLVLKDGRQVSGYYEGGTSRVIRFQTPTGLQEFDLLAVSEIRFGGDVVPSAPAIQTAPAATSAPATSSQAAPRLARPADAVPPGTSQAAIGTAFTLPRGSNVLVRMMDAINSEEHQAGQVFRASLAEPLLVEGIEVAPVDSPIRGRIVDAAGAGRVRGSAELRLELTEIVVNGITYAIRTSEYEEVAEGRGTETAQRVGAGAGIGAVIGAIVGGGKGAAIGAGVGAGTAGAAQVLTKGEKLYIPAETLLGFTLSEPLSIAAK
jgi:hypothetical protein